MTHTLFIIIINSQNRSNKVMSTNVPTSSSASGYNFKPFIKNISIEQVPGDRRKSGDTTNKTFFSNIKAQLNSIRTDVNKLVSKDTAKPLNVSGNRSFNATIVSKPDNSGNEVHVDRTAQRKSLYDSAQKPSYVASSYVLQNKITDLTSKLAQQGAKNEEISQQFEEERKNQTFLRDQISTLREKEKKYEHQLFNKNKQIDNLNFYYQRAVKQKQQYGKTIERLENQLKKTAGLKESLQKMQAELKNNAHLKETTPASVIPDPQLAQKLKEKDRTIANLNNQLARLQEQNSRLRYDLENSERSKQIQIAATVKNYEERISRAEAKSYKELGAGFEIKINELLDENYSLKNKINSMESHIEQQRVKMQSLTSTVEAYETRDRETGKGANQIQLQNLRQKVMQLQEQKDKLESDHQFQIMKLENTIDELKANNGSKNDTKSFNQILKDQINEIQNLKEKLREKNQAINKMKR